MARLRELLLAPSLREPWLAVTFWLTLLGVGAGAIVVRIASPQPLVDNSVGVWFQADDPNLAEYEANNLAFGNREWSVLLIETASVSEPAFLRDIASLTGDLQAVPHIRKVLSLASIRAPRMSGGAPMLVPLLDLQASDPAPALRDGLSKLPAMEHLLLPQGWGSRTTILFQSDNYLHDLDPYRLELVDSVHQLTAARASIRSHSLAGTTVINAELNRSARRDAIRFYGLVTAMVLLVGWLSLRDVRDLSVVLAVLAISVVVPMGGIAAAGVAFNMVTILLPLVLVSLSVCDVIHVINAFHGERRDRTAPEAARAAVARLWTPCLWTSVVTVAGMMSLAPSSVAPISQMGLATSAGLVLAWACSMTLVPALLMLFWRRGGREASSGWTPGDYGRRLLPWLEGRRRWGWLALAGVLALPMVGLGLVRIDTDYTRFFSPDAPVSRAYGELRRAGVPQSVVEIVVTAPGRDSVDTVPAREGMRALEQRVAGLPRVRQTLSEGTFLDTVDQAIAGPADVPRWVGYPDAAVRQLRSTAVQVGLTDLDDYVTPDQSRRRILLLTDYMSSRELTLLRVQVDAAAAELLPHGLRASLEGTTVLWANMDGEIGRTEVRSILMLAAVFVLLLPLLFGSIRLGMLGAVVNGLPLAMTFGLMGLLGIRVNMATALIGGVAIGSTVDSTLFFINRFQTERASGVAWQAAIDAAVRGVGDGILITTGILAGGFLCMTASSFRPTADFGVFTCFTVLTGAFLDIVINPILLGLVAPRSERTQAITPQSSSRT